MLQAIISNLCKTCYSSNLKIEKLLIKIEFLLIVFLNTMVFPINIFRN